MVLKFLRLMQKAFAGLEAKLKKNIGFHGALACLAYIVAILNNVNPCKLILKDEIMRNNYDDSIDNMRFNVFPHKLNNYVSKYDKLKFTRPTEARNKKAKNRLLYLY